MNRAAAAALAALLAVPAAAVGPGGSPAAAAGRVLRVTEKITGQTAVDLGEEGLTPGDRLTFTSEVARPNGRRLGTGAGECTLYEGETRSTAKYYCTEAFKLTPGQIFVSGLVDPGRKSSVWAITGGTGRFRGASGQLNVTKTAPDTFAEVFRFED